MYGGPGYPPQPYGAPTQPVGYPGQPGAPGGYPPQQGGYPPQQGGYPQQMGAPGAYPPQMGGPGGYPPQQGGYPQQQGGYPQQQGGYPQQQGGYPQQQGGYPQQQGFGGPQMGGGYAQQQQMMMPQRGVSFRTHHGTHMQAHSDGWIKTTMNPIGDWERFSVEPNPDGTVCIRTHHGTYVELEGNGQVRGVHSNQSPNARFNLAPRAERGANWFAFRCVSGQFLQAPPGNEQVFKGTQNNQDWEAFQMVNGSMQSGGGASYGPTRVAFRSWHGQQLQAHSDGTIKVANCPINDWERFTLEYNPDGSFFIRTHHGTYVNLEDNGMFRGVQGKHDHDSVFRFVPQPHKGGPNRFALQSMRGSYIQAPPNGDQPVKNSTNLGDWEVFERVDV